MGKRFLVFQHSPWEGPGRILLQAAARQHVSLVVSQVWKDKIPELSAFDALIVLGGSPNVDQEDIYPFLVQEKKAIRNWLQLDRPYLGFCLGHQLLAHVLGAKVSLNPVPSVGFRRGYITRAGRSHPVFANLPREVRLFKWHGQAVHEPLPSGLSLLATSVDCQVEAISLEGRPHIIGVQFDNHAAAPEDVQHWLLKDAKWLASLAGMHVDPGQVCSEAEQFHEDIALRFNQFFSSFAELLP